MSIRKRRRDRARERISRQKRQDEVVLQNVKDSMSFSMATLGGRFCPECRKPVPPRALVDLTGWYGKVHILGCTVDRNYCHKDRRRCFQEGQKYWGENYTHLFPEVLEVLE